MARRIPTIEVPVTANIPPGNITATEWVEQKAATDVMAALRFDPEHPNYGAVRGSIDSEPSNAVKAANRAAIQLAADDAAASGGTLVLKGTYWIDATVQLLCHVDAPSATICINDTTINPAVLVGSEVSGVRLANKHMTLPDIRQMERNGAPGWIGSDDTGLVLGNIYHCHITITAVRWFREAVRCSATGTGNVYNNIYIGILENNKVGMHLKPNAAGWVNENLYVGGRFQMNSGEGTNIPGAAHIKVSTNGAHPSNNNRWLKPSIEGNGPAFHIDANDLSSSIIDQARWEATPPRVRLVACNSLVFNEGFNAFTIEWTISSSANIQWNNRNRRVFTGGGGSTGVLHLQNTTSSASPAISIFDVNTSPVTAATLGSSYNVQIGATDTNFKAAADAFPRLQISATSSQIRGGNGIGDPTTNYIRPYASFGWQSSKGFSMWGANPPNTQPAAIPNTSGATLAALETEVNKLKAVLRQYGLIAT